VRSPSAAVGCAAAVGRAAPPGGTNPGGGAGRDGSGGNAGDESGPAAGSTAGWYFPGTGNGLPHAGHAAWVPAASSDSSTER
jgi:hypothetical protein